MARFSDDFRVDGKVALITGGARGIGAECARVLSAAGASVMITDVMSDLGKELAGQIVDCGGQAVYMDLDVTREDSWTAVIGSTINKRGGFDVLVNNAATEVMAPIADISHEDFRRVMSVNVDGVFLRSKHAVIAMRPGGAAGRGGSIINMSSVGGLIGTSWLSAYGASKGAVRILTKDIAVECGRLGYGIRCNSVHPGVVATEMGDTFLRKNCALAGGVSLERMKATFLAAHPIGRTGMPRDIANAVRFLAADASSWITGIELPVDGGWTAT
jgi:NAD(P)-dependent dehydrogenase (short-subunit alcohol dehydrogenase family)